MLFSHGFFPTKEAAATLLQQRLPAYPSTPTRQEARPSSFLNSSNRRPMPATATSNNSSKSSGAPRGSPGGRFVKNGSVRWVDLMPQKFDNKDQEEQGSQGIPVFPSWLLKPLCSQAQELELEFEECSNSIS